MMKNLSIDGREYAFETLPEAVKAQLFHLQAIEIELQRLRIQVAIHETAKRGYLNALKQEIEKIDALQVANA